MTTSTVIPMAVAGTLGNITGPNSDGILYGSFTQTDPTKVLLKEFATAALCFTEDAPGTYADETAALLSATADDVEVFPATPALDDAMHIGHATNKFTEFKPNTSTQGDGVWDMVGEYWDGSAYVSLPNFTDGSSGFTSATGIASMTWDEPVDWVKNTVDGVLAYWVRFRISDFTSVTTAPQLAQGFINTSIPTWTDTTADAIDAGTDDVDLLPVSPSVGDATYVGHASERFAIIELVLGQQATGTAIVVTPKYWNGSADVALPIIDDDSANFTGAEATHLIHFLPPADWVINTVANGPNGQAGYFIKLELTSFTAITQQPLGTQIWVYPLITGADGIPVPVTTSTLNISMSAQTPSATNNDSSFALINVTNGTAVGFTVPKGKSFHTAPATQMYHTSDRMALIQVTEDGTTELADASFAVNP